MKDKKRDSRNRIITAVNIALCIILIPVILINVAVIIGSYMHPEEIPGIFGIKPVAVLSGSMEDTFMAGDLIFIQETDPSALKKDDVICYLQEGQAVTHRIADIVEGEDGTPNYITKGDANNTEDRESVSPGQVQGVWNGVCLRGIGNFIVFLSGTTGMIAFIVCPVLLLIIWDLIRRWRLDKRENARVTELEAELKALKAAQDTTGDSGRDTAETP